MNAYNRQIATLHYTRPALQFAMTVQKEDKQMKKKNLLQLCLAGIFILTTLLSTAQISEPRVKQAVFFGKSKPVKEMKIVLPGEHTEEQRIIKNHMPYGLDKLPENPIEHHKPVMQDKQGTLKSKGPALNFEGVSNVNNGYPADPNGDVSYDHYIQSVNQSFAVWDKSGNMIYGPVDYQTIWDGFPGPWTNYIWCDPIIKYDRLADRWIICSMAFNNSQTIFYTMVAVSVSPDPLGAYYCYGYPFDNMNDYPKLSIWPNGYYITYNIYDVTLEIFLHALATVIDREAMLAGSPNPTVIEFIVPGSDSELFFPLPADFYGSEIPAELPGYITNVCSHNPGNPFDLSLDMYAFDPDWDTPLNSTFEQILQFDIGEIDPFTNFGPGAPQPNNDKNVITIPVYMMYPLSYRAFEDYESMVCSHTLWEDEIHYVKWYELRRDDVDWYIYQTGNYAPDNTHRYQPSIAINAYGDMALGYTASDENTFPSVRMTGRRLGDPLGEMTYQEVELFTGMNYINTYQAYFDGNRWGDYASMMVDPADDTTFWFTNMYPTAEANSGNWGTRIFKIDLTEEFEMVMVNAGNDTVICEDNFIFITQADALNYNALLWTSSGDGTFLVDNSLEAKYIRGNGDIENGQVTLTLQAFGYEAGIVVTDSMILFINQEPIAHAGDDATIWVGSSYTLQGNVEFSNVHEWTSSGDGTFNDPSLLDAIYTPGVNDISYGEVELTLTAFPLQACQDEDQDNMTIIIETNTAISDYSADNPNFVVLPNPTTGNITVQGEIDKKGLIILEIINASGEILFKGLFHSIEKQFSREIDLSYLKDGIYFIRINSDLSVQTLKVLKR